MYIYIYIGRMRRVDGTQPLYRPWHESWFAVRTCLYTRLNFLRGDRVGYTRYIPDRNSRRFVSLEMYSSSLTHSVEFCFFMTRVQVTARLINQKFERRNGKYPSCPMQIFVTKIEIWIEIFLIDKRYIYFHEIYFETRNNFLKYYFFREIIGRKTSRIENIS